jgi:hypothetical protein
LSERKSISAELFINDRERKFISAVLFITDKERIFISAVLFYADKADKNKLGQVQKFFILIFSLIKQTLLYQYYNAMSLVSKTQFGYCLIFKYIQNAGKKFQTRIK